MLTRIEWTDRVWNPVTGCTKVSQGCKHCYAEVMAKRTFGRLYPPVPQPIPPSQREAYPATLVHLRPRVFSDVQTHADRLDAPLRWRKPCRVFVNSMSDLFHEDVPDAFIDQVFAVMACARRHTFQVLSKRPERMRTYLNDPARPARIDAAVMALMAMHVNTEPRMCLVQPNAPGGVEGWPLPNVWAGVSAEDQDTADKRLAELVNTRAVVRFVSLEPMLGSVDLRLTGHFTSGFLDWVIVGGESGPKARPCDVAWIRSVVEQCKAAGVPCFVKQLGARPTSSDASGMFPVSRLPVYDSKGSDPNEWPGDLRVRQFPGEASA